MKLKEGFLLHKTAGQYLMVATGPAAADFNGLVRGNAAASYLLELLLEDTTEDALVDALTDRYEVERETAARDVRAMLEQLEQAGLLCE